MSIIRSIVQINIDSQDNMLLSKNILPDRFNSISEPVAGGIIQIGAEISTPSNIPTVPDMRDPKED